MVKVICPKCGLHFEAVQEDKEAQGRLCYRCQWEACEAERMTKDGWCDRWRSYRFDKHPDSPVQWAKEEVPRAVMVDAGFEWVGVFCRPNHEMIFRTGRLYKRWNHHPRGALVLAGPIAFTVSFSSNELDNCKG